MPSDSYIIFDNVGIAYGEETVFDKLSFSVRKQEFLCLLGPSGCGKSTTLRLMSGLLKPHAGSIRVGDREPSAAAADFSFVFQSPRLVSWRNALRNVTLASELRYGSGSRKSNEQRATALLDMVGLANEKFKRAGDLSGGERQRVAIARALQVDPITILMDEPFSALDVRTLDVMRREIITLWEKQKKTIVFVTHDIDEALFLADRIIVFSRKPTTILESLEVTTPRWRDMEGSGEMQSLRRSLLHLLRDQGLDE
ncbi:MAG: ABC transporter ATP-binding protein [Xanthobacteraceae bacterium]